VEEEVLRIKNRVTYRVIQEEKSILWEVIVLAIVSRKVHMNMCPILNGCGDIAIEIKNYKTFTLALASIVTPLLPHLDQVRNVGGVVGAEWEACMGCVLIATVWEQ
jgi:hypothetical protein